MLKQMWNPMQRKQVAGPSTSDVSKNQEAVKKKKVRENINCTSYFSG